MTRAVKALGASVVEGFARLVDVSPREMVVLDEETDWTLVGGDLRDAVEALSVPAAEEPEVTQQTDHIYAVDETT